MTNYLFIILLLLASTLNITAQEKTDSLLPVRGLCIAAPEPRRIDDFVKFIRNELAPAKINTLILRVDYGYRYESHPELSDSGSLSKSDVKKLVRVCGENRIRLIPQINLLGHQSWDNHTGRLLSVYPQFDETPLVKMPEKYAWPNEDKLYCKSYCPLHPDVHDVIFDLVDEICDVFETGAFHAGMDEVFFIGEDQCPRCSGRDRAELFAGEVTLIRNHLAAGNRQLWIWGDRLIDGKTTGLGEWEASYNNTHRAIDMIPKDIMICDWHYERPDQTAVMFAMKGFCVVTCPWRDSDNAVAQLGDMVKFRRSSTPEMSSRFSGMVQTVWSPAGRFLDNWYGTGKNADDDGQVKCFRAMLAEIKKLDPD